MEWEPTHGQTERDMLAITKMDFPMAKELTLGPMGELKEEFGRWVNLWVSILCNRGYRK